MPAGNVGGLGWIASFPMRRSWRRCLWILPPAIRRGPATPYYLLAFALAGTGWASMKSRTALTTASLRVTSALSAMA